MAATYPEFVPNFSEAREATDATDAEAVGKWAVSACPGVAAADATVPLALSHSHLALAFDAYAQERSNSAPLHPEPPLQRHSYT